MNWSKIFAPVFGVLRAQPYERSSRGLAGGVIAPLAERFGWNVWMLRGILILASVLLPVLGLPLYLILWILLPDASGRIHAQEWLRDLSR